MSFIKTSHDTLFQKHINTLLDDIGRSITVYSKNASKVDCPWCIYDPMTGRSSGQASPGKDWTTHPDYDGIGLVCPECKGVGYISINTTTTVPNVIIQDISGEQIVRGKYAYFKNGTKKLYGKLESILSDSSDKDSATIFDNANKIVIDSDDYRVVSLNRLGIKTRYLFEAIVERMDIIENNN